MNHRGQSLTEVALFFPIFLVILAGLVEVTNLTITRNRVTSAANAGARFGANGGTDSGMTTAVLNTVTQTLRLDAARWDIWAIQGTTDDSGLSEWQITHMYGMSETEQAINLNVSALQARVVRELQIDHRGASVPAAGIRFVGILASHNVDSILNMDAYMPGVYDTAHLALYRRTGTGDFSGIQGGCSAFPIGISQDYRSEKHVPILQAREGQIYEVDPVWLRWNDGRPQADETLAQDLQWPGTSLDYTDHGDAGTVLPGFPYVVRGYVEPGDPIDTVLHIGDWVAQGAFGPQSQAVFDNHVDVGRTLRVVIYDEIVRVVEFIAMRPLGLNRFEAIRIDRSCGQE